MPRIASRTRTYSVLLLLGLTVLSTPLLAATPIQQNRPLDPRGRVEIENLKGRIQVRAWNRAEVKIEGYLGQGVEKLEVDGNHQRLTVRVKYPLRGSGLGFLVGSDKTEPSELWLTVPLSADLQIDSVAADIDVSGVAPDELNIDSISGDVVVAAAPREASIDSISGDLRLTLNRANVRIGSVSGDVALAGRLGHEIRVETVSGQIDVTVRDTAVHKLAGSTVSGDLRVRTALARNGRISLESVSGDLDLRLPRTLSASVQAESFSGELHAPNASIDHRSHGPGSSFKHRYGSGSGEVSIETFSGDAQLQLD